MKEVHFCPRFGGSVCMGYQYDHNHTIIYFDGYREDNYYLKLQYPNGEFTNIPIPDLSFTVTNTYTQEPIGFKAQLMRKIDCELVASSPIFMMYVRKSIPSDPNCEEVVPPNFQTAYDNMVGITQEIENAYQNGDFTGAQGPIGPVGPEGPRGASTIEVSETEPTDPEIQAWLNPKANPVYLVTREELQAAIEAIGTVFNFKGSKPTFADLPAEGNNVGDVWFVEDESVGYIWLDSNKWEPFGPAVDLSGYATKEELEAAMATAGVGKKTAEGGETFNSAAIAGDNSHAEGMQTNAIGRYSHTECLGENNAFPGTIVSNTRVEEKRFDVNATIGKIKLPYVAILYQDGVEKVSMLVKEVKPKEGVFTLVGYTRPAGLVDGTYDLVIAKGIATKEAAHAEGTKTIANARHAHTEGDKTIVTSAVEKDGTSIGTGIAGHAEGTETMVYGANGHAEGFRTVASGENSHAEGTDTTASRSVSHAEGEGTTASGKGSHAEGTDTTASSIASHAEGNRTTASDTASHAEGEGTTASSIASHAEGRETTASGYASHAEGWDVIASEQVSHAEGLSTTASGSSSHAEGNRTTASGKGSHAEGGSMGNDGYKLPDRNDNGVIIQGSLASGIESHAEGCQTHASGYVSHAEGEGTTASGYASHAEGEGTTASSTASHAEGSHTTASDSYSHAEGWTTTASGSSSHAEGCQTHASGHTSHAEGSYTTASGNYSHAEGRETVASGNAQHVQGQYNIPDTNDGTPEGTPNDKYAHIVGNGEYGSPSNAHTLDWEGNSWYQGSVLVGGKDMDTPMAVVAPDHIIIKASDSEDRFKITVDSTGAIKAEKVV